MTNYLCDFFISISKSCEIDEWLLNWLLFILLTALWSKWITVLLISPLLKVFWMMNNCCWCLLCIHLTSQSCELDEWLSFLLFIHFTALRSQEQYEDEVSYPRRVQQRSQTTVRDQERRLWLHLGWTDKLHDDVRCAGNTELWDPSWSYVQ